MTNHDNTVSKEVQTEDSPQRNSFPWWQLLSYANPSILFSVGPSLCIKLLRALVRCGRPVFLWLWSVFPILFQSRLSNPATIILLWYQLQPLCVCYMSKWGLSFNRASSFSFFLSSSPAWERVIYSPGRSPPQTVFPMCCCFILGSSADTQQPPGYWTGGEPVHVSQGASLSAPLFSSSSVPSLLIILLLLETISLRLSTRNDVLIHPADVDQWVGVTLAVGIQCDVIRGSGRWLLHSRYVNLLVVFWLRRSRPKQSSRGYRARRTRC